MYFIRSLGFLFFCFFTTTVSAQLLSTDNAAKRSNNFSIVSEAKNDWMIYADTENRVVYIDFEKINTNLSLVTVKNSTGIVIFKDDNLWQLPVNTIYEIDCKKFVSGDYILELKSFTKTCSRTIQIK